MDVANTAAFLRKSYFHFFLAEVFKELHPGKSLTDAAYMNAMSFALQKCWETPGDRLLVTVPPRHLKSIAAAVALPAWVLGRDPSAKIMVATYGEELSREHAANFATIMRSQWYRAIFPRTQIKQSNQSELRTSAGGGRRCVTLGGATTGFGADLIVIDDLMKAQDATSQAMRDKTRDYYSSGLLSRFNDPKNGRVVSIQQRLHEDDLAASLLDTGRFRHLNLFAIAEEPVDYPLNFDRTWRRQQGEVLEPERLDVDALAGRREELGSRVFSAQYQQNPIPPDGAIVRIEKLSLVEDVPDGAEFEFVVQSWDTAASIGPRSDFCVCMTFGYYRGAWYLADLFRKRLEFDQLEATIFEHVQIWKPEKVLIEDSSNGRAFLQRQRIKKFTGLFQKVIAKDSKEERLIAQTDFLHSDRIRFCTTDNWWPELKRELAAFPEVAHDDQVDSLSQFCGWVTGRFGRKLLNTNGKTGKTDLLKGPDGRYLPFSGVR